MIKFYSFLKGLMVIALVVCAEWVNAQIRSVIPVNPVSSIALTSKNAVSLSFDLSFIPAHAIIDSAKFDIVLNNRTDGTTSIIVTYDGNLPPGVTSKQINSRVLPKGTVAGTEIMLNVNKAFITASSPNRFNIILTNKIPNSVSGYYASANINLAPRIIVYYSYKNNAVDWAGSHADGQHSGRTLMRFADAGHVSNFRMAPLQKFNKVQTDLVMYKNQVYLIDGAIGKTTVYAIDPVLNVQNKVGDFDAVTQMPVIVPSGRMYYVSNNKVDVVNLHNYADRKTAISLSTTEIVSAAPASGRDGSLYLAMNSVVRAYTPYPNHQLIWQYDMPDNKSTVALSPDETMAYVINRSGKLVVINTINGHEVNTTNLYMKTPDPNEGVTIPLVTTTGYVYVANKLIDADSIYVFNSQLGRVQSIGGVNLSQPVSGTDTLMKTVNTSTVYFMNAGNLVQSFPTMSHVVIPFKTNLSVRSLISDMTNNIYCLGNDQVLYSYINGNLNISPANMGDDVGFQKAMIIAPDGSLYTATSSSLFTLRPVYKSDYSLKSTDAQLNNYTFRGNQLNVNGSYILQGKKILIGSQAVNINTNVRLDPSANVLIESGGKVSFQTGFSVPVGAQLTIKNNY
jgi:hypothetical protein